MRTSSKAALAAGLSLLAVAAIAQDRPESLLPPGFGDPAPTPAPPPRGPASPTTPRAPAAAPPATSPGDPPGAVVQPLPGATPPATDAATAAADAPPVPPPVDAEELARYEMPLFARRSLNAVGIADEISADAFGTADGRYIEALMRRTAAPLPSRWLSILLRRTLVSRVRTPARVDGADFAAERAWLLLRMGESVAARSVVQAIDNADYTPKLYQVAMNAMLATGDPAGLCPLADAGLTTTGEGGWVLAQPMCAALAGDMARGRSLLAAARRRRVATGIDLQLAEKVMGAGGLGRQAVTIEWDSVDRLNIWRFGLAAATGATVPDSFYDGVGRQATYWRALSPGIAAGGRIAAAEAAAGQGVLSSLALVDLYGAVDADENAASTDSATAQDLRTAYADRDAGARLAAIRQLWGKGTPVWSRLVLTARAAARQPARAGVAEADGLVAAMLSAGLDRTATRWAGSVGVGGDGWAMLALADPDARRRFGYADVQGYAGTGDAVVKRRLFFAGLAGLGRLAPDDLERTAEALDVRIGAANSWTRALDRAASSDQPGTVALLAAIGMQAADWRGVPPEALYRIVAALRAVGLTGEARMIAAEAIARA